MRITLEQTNECGEHGTVIIESSEDCGSAQGFFDTVRRAALAWGFTEKTIEEFVPYD